MTRHSFSNNAKNYFPLQSSLKRSILILIFFHQACLAAITLLPQGQAGSIPEGLTPTDPSVFEGPCRIISPADNFTRYLPLVALPNVYSVTFASESSLRVYASTFLGRPARDKFELSRMCLNVMTLGPLMVQTGYRHQTFVNVATPYRLEEGLGTFRFSNYISESPGVKTSFQQNSIETFIWSDGSDHLLLARCINDEFMEWKLASKVLPSPEVKATVLGVIELNGFDPSKAFDLTNMSQTGSPYSCPPTPTLVEAGSQALINHGIALPPLPSLAQQPQVEVEKSPGEFENPPIPPMLEVEALPAVAAAQTPVELF